MGLVIHKRFACLFAITGDGHPISFVFQNVFDEIADIGLVIHNQYQWFVGTHVG